MYKHEKLPVSWKRPEILQNLNISVLGATFRCFTKNDYWFEIISTKN